MFHQVHLVELEDGSLTGTYGQLNTAWDITSTAMVLIHTVPANQSKMFIAGSNGNDALKCSGNHDGDVLVDDTVTDVFNYTIRTFRWKRFRNGQQLMDLLQSLDPGDTNYMMEMLTK